MAGSQRRRRGWTIRAGNGILTFVGRGLNSREVNVVDESRMAAIAWSVAETADELHAQRRAGNVRDSIFGLYILAIGEPDWAGATTVAERARIIHRVLRESASIQDLLQEDLDSGLLDLHRSTYGRLIDVEEEREERRRGGFRGEPPEALPQAPEEDGAPVAERSRGGWWRRHSRESRSTDSPTRDRAEYEDVRRGWNRPERRPESYQPGQSGVGREGDADSYEEDSNKAEIVETWLNADLPYVDTSQPLLVDQQYTLALSFGEKLEGALKSVQTSLAFPPRATSEVDHLDLTIQLLSDDFRTPPLPQAIRVMRNGKSLGRCLFDITPLKSGPAVVRARVEFAGNWVQQIDLRFDVSGAGLADGTPATDVTVKEYGRPLNPGMTYASRAASMTFTPDEGGFKLFVRGVTEKEVSLRLTPFELDAAIGKVRSELLSIVSDPTFAHSIDIPEELQAQALRKLAFAGFLLYSRIFNSPFSSPELQAVGRWLRELPDDIPILQIVSNGFPVPWALLYPAEKLDDSNLNWSNFVGMRHVIEQVPMRDDIRIAPPPVTIASAPELAVRVLYNDGIDETMPSHPVAAQRDYWKACMGLSLSEGTTADDLIRTALAPGSSDKVLYFYCHAVGSNKNPDDSRLEFSGGEKVTLGSLWAYAPINEHLASNPLVFINACESGRLSPLFYNDFVPYFLGKGARGVIGTEAKIPGLFASEWAKAFFSRFFAGERLGDTVLGLRREFLAEHGNPLGLLYGVHCDTDTRIDPAISAAPLSQ